jgi:branched-chain amino acid transport system ATP-binding protein
MHEGCVIASGLPQDVRVHPAVRSAYLGDHGAAP